MAAEAGSSVHETTEEFLGAEGGSYDGEEDEEDEAALAEEREEERLEAIAKFDKLDASGEGKMSLSVWPTLLEELNVNRTPGQASKLFMKLSEDGEMVNREAAVEWYLAFIFEDNEEEEEELDSDGEEGGGGGGRESERASLCGRAGAE